MSFSAPPGVFDILPNATEEAWQNSHLWDYVERVARETAIQYGYREIQTPIFERTELFQRSVGETSDIVSKEMYTFEDKGGRSLSLRPEGTAPVMRAFIEHHLDQQGPLQKLFYIAPMFRYERSQAGRYRQHHQFGVEAIGSSAPEQDAEIIDLIYMVYSRLGLKNLHVYVNSLGDPASRETFRNALKAYLNNLLPELSKDSQDRFDTNPLRILDSKDLKDQELLKNAPSILNFLNDECKDHFHAFLRALDRLDIPYTVNPKLVRGLDYYNKTVFEIVSGDLGAQNSVAGGGRYDGLMKVLGGPDLPCLGFGAGIERVIQTMLKQGVSVPKPPSPEIFLIALGDRAKEYCFSLLHKLHEAEVPSQMDFSGRKLNRLLQYADSIQAKYVAVFGDDEMNAEEVELKEMATGRKFRVPFSRLVRTLRIESRSKEFMQLWNEMAEPFSRIDEAEFFLHKLSYSLSDTSRFLNELFTLADRLKDEGQGT